MDDFEGGPAGTCTCPCRDRIRAENGGQACTGDITNDNRQFTFLGSIPELFPPKLRDSPNLCDCPHCGRSWISRLAMFCPGCGFSMHMAVQKREGVRRSFYLSLGCSVMLLALSGWLWDMEVPAGEIAWPQMFASVGYSAAALCAVLMLWCATEWQGMKRSGEMV